MRIKVALLTFSAILIYTKFAECGAVVAKQHPHGTIHVQVPVQAPHIHLTEQPVMEGSPTIHLNINGQPQQPAKVETPEPEYQAQVLSSKKPDLLGKSSARASNAKVEDIVDMPHLINALRTSSQAWTLIIDDQDKAAVIQEFMDGYQKQGITISKLAAHYSGMIDDMTRSNPRIVDLPFDRILQVVAVMEYDFNNGQDKDALAQQILGPQVYEKNKERLLAGDANNSPEQQ